uniref:Uncharacterized protein n=1 Tax=Arundo donax TaxID=35708 RepID=A0A0A8YR56_ARUDO
MGTGTSLVQGNIKSSSAWWRTGRHQFIQTVMITTTSFVWC